MMLFYLFIHSYIKLSTNSAFFRLLRLSNAILLVSSTLIAWMLLRQVIMAYALGDERGKEEVIEKPPSFCNEYRIRKDF